MYEPQLDKSGLTDPTQSYPGPRMVGPRGTSILGEVRNVTQISQYSKLIIEKSKPKRVIEKLRNKEEAKPPTSIPWESQFGQNEQENKIKENPGFYTESNKPKRQIEKLRTRQEIKPTPWESQFNQMNQGIISNNEIEKNPGFFKETPSEFNKEKSRYEQDLTPPTSIEIFVKWLHARF